MIQRIFICLALILLFSNSALAAEKDNPKLRELLEVLEDKPEAPDFTLTSISGSVYTLSDFRGQPLFIHFWAYWCPHCTREVSTLNQMYELYHEAKDKGIVPKDVEFFAINWGDSKESIIKWAEANEISLEPTPAGDVHLLLDEEKAVSKAWKVDGLPTTFLVDENGRIVARAVGERTWTTPGILDQLNSMVQE